MTSPKREEKSQNHFPMIHTSTKVQHNLLCHFKIASSFKLQCLALLLPVLIHSLCLKSKSIAWMLNTGKTLDCILEDEIVQFQWTGKSLYLADFQGLWRPKKVIFSFYLFVSFLWFPPSFPPVLLSDYLSACSIISGLTNFSFNSQRVALTSNSTTRHTFLRTTPK